MTSKTELQVSDMLWDYPGGIHPKANKAQSSGLPIGPAWIPEQLIIPLRQHIGQAGQLIVEKGEYVLKGQALTEPQHGLSVPVHAPTSGTIIDFCDRASNHPSGLPEKCIILAADGKDLWRARTPSSSIENLSNNELLERILMAGVAGLGGAGFPTQVKLSPLKPVQLLLINGAECEPYITADDTLMQAHAEELILGCAVMAQLLNHPKVVIAIEDDKPLAIDAVQQALQSQPNFQLKVIPSKYPSGGERQLIQIITGHEVPSRGLPVDLGIVVQNVGTAFAVKRAVYDDQPLLQRVVTLTGDRVSNPSNHWVLLGTPIEQLLKRHKVKSVERVIVGGPMMGYELPNVQAPVIKTTNCLLVPGAKELPNPKDEQPCIRCGACAEACPVSLLPQQLHWYANANDHTKLEEHHLFDCIECGACAYVCPSQIPLVLEYRQAKASIRQTKQEQLNAERARQRFDARNERLEREKQARAEKHQQATQARITTATQALSSGGASDKAAIIAAALARAKEKKQADNTASIAVSMEPNLPDNTEMIAKREARKTQARLHREMQQQPAITNSQPSTDDKASKVAAAVARAKAKRDAQQAPSSGSEVLSNDSAAVSQDQSVQVAAAVARAKEKRLKQAEQASTTANLPPSSVADANVDDKKANVAAAIAKAKAKQALAQKDKS